uniref:T9SS type A sorting domain-containing protein n=1 Tax=Roseivirga sp. TaxID=1964215 RepID=UPI004048BE91
MKKNFFLLFVLLGYLAIGLKSTLGQSIEWNGYRMTYVGPTQISKTLDGNKNSVVKVENLSNNTGRPLYFDVFIEGLVAESVERNVHGEYGFAIFPNGGAVSIKPGEKTFTQTWLTGVYEDRMQNVPPVSGASKAYQFHFLFAQGDNAGLYGPYPKAPTTLDMPVTLTFINDETLKTYNSGSHKLTLVANSSSSAQFSMELFTESGGLKEQSHFQQTNTQMGNGNDVPFKFSFDLAVRDDWYVRIKSDGNRSEYFHLNLEQVENTITLANEALGQSPFEFTLIESIKTPTGFWRGAVSEAERTFVAIPGAENWGPNSSPKNKSTIYKMGFDGDIKWQKEFGAEAWGGDMTQDGAMVAVASSGAVGPNIFNNNTGGDYITLFNGSDGSLYHSIAMGILSKNVRFSPNAKYLAIGDQNGTFHLFDVVNKVFMEQNIGLASFGQNRELLWLDDQALVISTGDGNVRKYTIDFEAKKVELTWTAYVGGWAFINGFNLSADRTKLATGAKSKDQAVINTATGEVLWMKHSGSFDSRISPNDQYMAAFNGNVYNLSTGEMISTTHRAGVSMFSSNSKYLLQADRVEFQNGTYSNNAVNIYNLYGDKMTNASGAQVFYDAQDQTKSGGEQAQWAYWSADDSRVIVLSRDMDLSEEVGISIFSVSQADTEAPTIAANTRIEASLDATGKYVLNIDEVNNGSTDNVEITQMTISKSEFTCADLGENTITFTAKDVAGNSSSAEIVVNVIDEIKPVVNAKTSYTIELNAAGEGLLKWEDIDEGSTDNCSIEERQLSKTNFTVADAGENKITYTLVDNSGNSASVEVDIQVDVVLSAEEFSFESNKVTVYPNPVNDYLSLEFSKEINTSSIKRTALVETSGRILKEIVLVDLGDGKLGFSTTDLKAGMYFLHLDVGNDLYLIKFIVIH